MRAPEFGKISAFLILTIRSSGETLYRIAKDAGVDYSSFHRFVNKKQTIRLDQADRLAAYFSLELTKPKA